MKNKKSADDSLKSFANNENKKKFSSLPRKIHSAYDDDVFPLSTHIRVNQKNQILMFMTEAINFSMKIDFCELH
jgi:hypothetical protein